MYLFDIISVVLLPDPNTFLRIPASAADATAVSHKEINTLLANGVIRLFINGNPVFNKGPNNLLKILLTVPFLIIELLQIYYQQMNY